MNLSFNHRIIGLFLIMTVLSIFVGYFAFISIKSMQKFSRAIMKENVSSLKAAEELELALLSQKGFVASYFLDGNASWLRILEDKKNDFKIWFKKAREVALTDNEKIILRDILLMYSSYDKQRNRAIRLYQNGNLSEAKDLLLNDIKLSLDKLYEKCEDLILANEMIIAQAEQLSQSNVSRMIAVIWSTVIATIFLGGLLGFFISRKFNEQLIRAAKMSSLGQVAANVAHEIRNPLTSIKMRVYTLGEELRNNSSAKEDLNIISEEMCRMEKIVQSFLDFSRLPPPNFQRCDLERIFEEIVKLVLPKARSQNIEIKKRSAFLLPETIADKEQIRQVFLNIVLNAIESMPQGGVLEVSSSVISNRKGLEVIEIKVRDTGCGIAKEIIKKISEPFFTTKAEGTGLGLFIASKIVERHKGNIIISSEQKKGTSVNINLPLVKT